MRLIGHNDGGAIPRKAGRQASPSLPDSPPKPRASAPARLQAPAFEELLKHALANNAGIPKATVLAHPPRSRRPAPRSCFIPQ